MEKSAKIIKTNKTAKIIYIIYVLALFGLLFMPSLFTSGSYSFTGGKTLFSGYKAQFQGIFKNRGFGFSGSFSQIKLSMFIVEAVLILNLAILISMLFVKAANRIRALATSIFTVNIIAFFAVLIVDNSFMGLEPYAVQNIVFVLYLALTFIAITVLGFAAFKSVLKTFIFIISFVATLGFFYKTIDGTNGYIYTRFFIQAVKSKTLSTSVAALVAFFGGNTLAKVYAYVYTYGYVIAGLLVAINLIISTISLLCSKIKAFDIVRFALALLASAAVFAVLIIKGSGSIIKLQGFIAIVAANLILVVLASIGACKNCKKKCGCVKLAREKKKPIEKQPQASVLDNTQEEKAPIINEKTDTKVKTDIVEEQTDIFDEIPFDENEIPQEVVDETVQLEIEKLPPEARAVNVEPEIKEVKQERESYVSQIDIESLKKEILEDLYMKEKTSTAAKDIAPVSIIPQPEKEPKKYSPPAYNPYIMPREQAIPDRFFDSLTKEEKEEFENLFIKRIYGENKRLPIYEIGGDNTEFFARVFIFIGRYRNIISESLLSKMYLYSVAL